MTLPITEKHAYYYALRAGSRKAVVDSINSKFKRDRSANPWIGMVIGSINKQALDAARLEWPKYYSLETHNGFVDSWETLFGKFIHIPAFFDIALWQADHDGTNHLQALALGKPSDGKTHLTLNWIERSFAPTHFRGGALLPILACAEEYARVLGCHRVLIKNPVDPSKYARYGYKPYRLSRVKAAYLYKEL